MRDEWTVIVGPMDAETMAYCRAKSSAWLEAPMAKLLGHIDWQAEKLQEGHRIMQELIDTNPADVSFPADRAAQRRAKKWMRANAPKDVVQ